MKFEAFLLDVEDTVMVFVWHRSHKSGLMLIWIEGDAVWVEALETMPLECLHQDGLCQLEAIVQAYKVLKVLCLLILGKLLFRHHSQCPVEIIHAVNEIFGKLLDGKVPSRLHFAGRPVLQVLKLGFRP